MIEKRNRSTACREIEVNCQMINKRRVKGVPWNKTLRSKSKFLQASAHLSVLVSLQVRIKVAPFKGFIYIVYERQKLCQHTYNFSLLQFSLRPYRMWSWMICHDDNKGNFHTPNLRHCHNFVYMKALVVVQENIVGKGWNYITYGYVMKHPQWDIYLLLSISKCIYDYMATFDVRLF